MVALFTARTHRRSDVALEIEDMKIEDMNFEPYRGFALFMIGISIVYTLVFGTVAVVNVYRQLRDPTSLGDVFGWFGTLTVTFACILLLLYFTTAVYRVSFYEAGIVTLGLRGRRFVPWNTVRGASLGRFKGTVELALRVDGRRLPVSVPLTSYRKSSTLLAEVRRRLPVPVNDPGNVAATLTDN